MKTIYRIKYRTRNVDGSLKGEPRFETDMHGKPRQTTSYAKARAMMDHYAIVWSGVAEVRVVARKVGGSEWRHAISDAWLFCSGNLIQER